MAAATRGGGGGGIPKMRAALRHLCQHGDAALRPQQVVTAGTVVPYTQYVAKPSKTVWKRPLISKRVGNVLRKKSIANGTYRTFDRTTGIGWNKQWDLLLFANRYATDRFPPSTRVSKKTKRERTREDRAQKLEAKLLSADELIEDYYVEKQESKVQDKSFEARMKRMSKVSGGGGGGGAPS